MNFNGLRNKLKLYLNVSNKSLKKTADGIGVNVRTLRKVFDGKFNRMKAEKLFLIEDYLNRNL